MSKDNSFHNYIVYDLLGDFPNISSKAMFGGYGIYKDGKIFAIIANDELYLKGHEKTKEFFESNNSQKFAYDKKGKTYNMNYWIVPEEVYENRDDFAEWINLAIKS